MPEDISEDMREYMHGASATPAAGLDRVEHTSLEDASAMETGDALAQFVSCSH